ncbi:MAG: mercury methylation corrinoid protein HgcA [Treponema sp.]|nr:mercury methylation corrinoid protein HgcA [Treponema sp.]
MSQDNCCCAGNSAGNSCCGAESSVKNSPENTCGCGCQTEETIPTVSASLSFKDILGAWKVRWGIGRNNYKVDPGLCAVGNPDDSSPVFVSANYKLSFDILRKNLAGMDCRILVLDTKGINVWCAAGKGTFGTEELVNRIKTSGLGGYVSHRTVIVPQLGATGVSAREVARLSGFTVIYGPVRAADIKEFVSAGYRAGKDMRTVKFSIRDRIVLTPIEIAEAAKISLSIFGVIFLLNLFAARPLGIKDLIVYIAAILTGTFLTPVLLPFIPGRAFAFKGWILGALITACIVYAFGWFTQPMLLLGIGYMLALPACSAYLALNFTGSSTYTSYSGVIKEIKIAMPVIIFLLASGIVLVLIKTFIG